MIEKPAVELALEETLMRYGCAPEDRSLEAQLRKLEDEEIASKFDATLELRRAIKARKQIY